MEASIFGAAGNHPVKPVVNAGGRPIHTNFVCQGGTTCVATGQDRRLGDFFTNAVDPRGCVLIASGDTTVKAPNGTERPTALPIFLRQNGGPGLKGRSCAPKRRPGTYRPGGGGQPGGGGGGGDDDQGQGEP